jgi:ribosome-associated translation inhibitor RaiA
MTITITYRGLAPSPFIDEAVHAWARRLDRVHDRIQSCHVWIALPHTSHRNGPRFQVRVVVSIPCADIAITRDGGHDDAYLAIADAFGAARRSLVARAQNRRGDRQNAQAVR